ncbi:LOW QUALITY PROTEIN: hypothetical protein TorRG33x02_354050 [Trema orientale]|uniref:Uncharacterized protein n=1 Tax=Trema orientale TaxID=63057 RepID=A0A2P5ABS8_TREOI|nr:LOW QUALITY PROTEIN: hypothetical protein TorRG33x02_354050 [Trema orientale]
MVSKDKSMLVTGFKRLVLVRSRKMKAENICNLSFG